MGIIELPLPIGEMERVMGVVAMLSPTLEVVAGVGAGMTRAERAAARCRVQATALRHDGAMEDDCALRRTSLSSRSLWIARGCNMIASVQRTERRSKRESRGDASCSRDDVRRFDLVRCVRRCRRAGDGARATG